MITYFVTDPTTLTPLVLKVQTRTTLEQKLLTIKKRTIPYNIKKWPYTYFERLKFSKLAKPHRKV